MCAFGFAINYISQRILGGPEAATWTIDNRQYRHIEHMLTLGFR